MIHRELQKKIKEEAYRLADMFPPIVFYLYPNGHAFIEDNHNRLDDVEHEISKKQARELEKEYIVYVRDPRPSVLKRVSFAHLTCEEGTEELRKRAKSMMNSDRFLTNAFDLSNYYQACSNLRSKLEWKHVEYFIRSLVEKLRENALPVDVMAYIIFSASRVYSVSSTERSDFEHIEAVFREMVDGGEEITDHDVDAALHTALLLFREDWGRFTE